MKKAIYPGSFDPLTFGHMDIINRASRIVDELVVGVLNNSAKNSLFSLEERVSMIEEMTKDIPNVTVASFEGLLVEFMNKIDATIIVRGLRAVTDFEYELQIAQAVAWAKEKGIAQANSKGRFNPDAACTRAEIAAFLYRMSLSE